MPGAQLFGLMNGLDAGRFHFRAHFLRLISHHDEDTLRRRDLKRGIDGVPHERLASGPMQHLGHPGLHARALPRGKNHDCGVIEHRLLV